MSNGRPGFRTLFHSRIPGNGNGQFPYRTGMLPVLLCEFQYDYDITQTVHLTNGSRSAACRMHNAVPSYCQAKPSALSTSRTCSLPSNHGLAAAEVASCDHGDTPRPTGHRTAHHTLILISSNSALSSVQCPVPLLYLNANQ